MINLTDYLDNIEAEEKERTSRRDIKSLLDGAKRAGLITSPGEAIAFKVAARRARAVAIEKSGGTPAAELGTMKSSWIHVTPEIAALWLKNNFNNRPVSQDTVNAYAREMKRGKWLPVHQGIAFNAKDELTDGQHRLLAIMKSGCTVLMLVTFGMPIKVQGTRMTGMDVVDRGKPRSVADQLKIQHHEKNGSVLAMLVNRLVNICTPERMRKLSVGEVLDVHDMLRESIDYVIEHRPRAHGLRQAGVLAAFALVLPLGERVKEMFSQLTSGQNLPEGSPLALLRAFLVSDEAILLTRGNDRALSELVLQTLWLEFHDKKVDTLELGTEGADYFRDVQKETVQKIAAIFAMPDEKPAEGRKAA